MHVLKSIRCIDQDVKDAVTREDVEKLCSNAVEAASRISEDAGQRISTLEEQLEMVSESKADRANSVCQEEVAQQIHAAIEAADSALEDSHRTLATTMAGKAEEGDVQRLEKRLSGRLSTLESAILKGLKAISDKVASALTEKASNEDYGAFKLQVHAALNDLFKATYQKASGARAVLFGGKRSSACLSCEAHVSTNPEECRAAIHDSFANRMFTPEALPEIENFRPTIGQISSSDPTGASFNAGLMRKKREKEALLGKRSPANNHSSCSTLNASRAQSEHWSSPCTPITPPTCNTAKRTVKDGSACSSPTPTLH